MPGPLLCLYRVLSVGRGPDMSGPYREANFYASGSLSTVISTKFRLMKLSAPESRV